MVCIWMPDTLQVLLFTLWRLWMNSRSWMVQISEKYSAAATNETALLLWYSAVMLSRLLALETHGRGKHRIGKRGAHTKNYTKCTCGSLVQWHFARLANSNANSIHVLVKRRRAWTGKPTLEDGRHFLRQHPGTTMLTCTIAGAADLNDLCIAVHFPRRQALVCLHADVEANPKSYELGKLKSKR